MFNIESKLQIYCVVKMQLALGRKDFKCLVVLENGKNNLAECIPYIFIWTTVYMYSRALLDLPSHTRFDCNNAHTLSRDSDRVRPKMGNYTALMKVNCATKRTNCAANCAAVNS